MNDIQQKLEELEKRITVLENSNGRQHKSSSMGKKEDYKQGSTASYGLQLIKADKFFENVGIKTTDEIVARIKHKYNKTIPIGNAVRDLFPLVREGHLDRDFIEGSPKMPKGAYIWFLPTTPRNKVEEFKSRFQ